MSSIANSTGSAKKSIPNVESQPMLNVAPILQMDGAEAARIVGTAVTDNPSQQQIISDVVSVASGQTGAKPVNLLTDSIDGLIKIEFGLDDKGILYSQQIAGNVFEKLRIALGIPKDEVAHDKLKQFFAEKFAPAETSEFLHNAPEQPELEMLNREIFGYVAPDQEKEKERISREANTIREQMMGYANAILVRQDAYDNLKSMESFFVETATRRVLKDLTGYYTESNNVIKKDVAEVRTLATTTSKSFLELQDLVKKLRKECEQIPNLNKKLQTEATSRESMGKILAKDTELANFKLEAKITTAFERLESVPRLEAKVEHLEGRVDNCQQITLNTKKDIFETYAKQQLESLEGVMRMKQYEAKLQQTTEDASFWLDTYTKAYKENEKTVQSIKLEMEENLENIKQTLNNRVSTYDMKVNFKKLNDMLFTKFRQSEDTKQAVRDLIAYQKFYYPIQLQAAIGENLGHLEVSRLDQDYQFFAKARYQDLLKKSEDMVVDAKKNGDIDLMYHYHELDRYELTGVEWKTAPFENPKHDYVTDLLNRYLEDLHEREHRSNWEGARLCDIVRKPVTLKDMNIVIEEEAAKCLELLKSSEQKVQEFKEAIRIKQVNDRCSKHVRGRLGFHKDECYKRSISTIDVQKLEEHTGDVDDFNALEERRKNLRRSQRPWRGHINPAMLDIVEWHMSENRDMLKSVTDSECSEMWRVSEIDLGDQRASAMDSDLLPERAVGRRGNSMRKDFTTKKDISMDKKKSKSSSEDKVPERKMSKKQTMKSQKTFKPTPEVAVGREKEVDTDSVSSFEMEKKQTLTTKTMPGNMIYCAVNIDANDFSIRVKPENENSPNDAQMMMLMTEQMARKLGATAQSQPHFSGDFGVGGSQGMTPTERRAIISDAKNEIRPLIQQLCEFQIQKANAILKAEVRKLDASTTQRFHDHNRKLEKEIRQAKIDAKVQDATLLEKMEKEIRMMQQKLCRDRSDYDRKFSQHWDFMSKLDVNVARDQEYIETLSVVFATLLENVNMQMEAETADMIDRRMMQLFGVAHKNLEKSDVMNNSKHLTDVRNGDTKAMYGDKLTKMIEIDGIPEIGLQGYQKQSPRLNIQSGTSMPNIEERFSLAQTLEEDGGYNKPLKAGEINQAFQDKTALNNESLRKECRLAHQVLKQTGALPITVDSNCLSCMNEGRDTQIILKMFKTACLKYEPSHVAYREHTLSRTSLLGMRRQLVDEIVQTMSQSKLFKDTGNFPRKYFDDLVVETQMQGHQMKIKEKLGNAKAGAIDAAKLRNTLQTARPLPFHEVSGKNADYQALQQQKQMFTTFQNSGFGESTAPRTSALELDVETTFNRPQIMMQTHTGFNVNTASNSYANDVSAISAMDRNAIAIRDLGQTIASKDNLNTLTLDSDSNKDSRMGLINPHLVAAAATARHNKNKTTIIREERANQSPTGETSKVTLVPVTSQKKVKKVSNTRGGSVKKLNGHKFNLTMHTGGQQSGGNLVSPLAGASMRDHQDNIYMTGGGKYTNLGQRLISCKQVPNGGQYFDSNNTLTMATSPSHNVSDQNALAALNIKSRQAFGKKKSVPNKYPAFGSTNADLNVHTSSLMNPNFQPLKAPTPLNIEVSNSHFPKI